MNIGSVQILAQSPILLRALTAKHGLVVNPFESAPNSIA
jgi:hypothetical protein